jgi:hypothetical protein
MSQWQRNAIAKVPLSVANSQDALKQETGERAKHERQSQTAHNDDANSLRIGEPVGMDPCHRILRSGRSQTTKLPFALRTVLYGRA